MRQGVVGACVTAQRSAGGPSAEQGSEGTAPRRRADTSAAAVHRESLPSVPLKAPPRPPTWRQLRRRVCRLHGGGHKGDPLVLGRHVVRVGAAKHVDVCSAASVGSRVRRKGAAETETVIHSRREESQNASLLTHGRRVLALASSYLAQPPTQACPPPHPHPHPPLAHAP